MFEKYVDIIEQNGGITPQIISEIISDHESLRSRTVANYERYKAEKDGSGVPIYKRTFDVESANKINNKLANDFFSEIIDTKVGYMFGVPVSVMLDKSAPGYEELSKKIERFRKMNNFDDLNSEAGKFAAMCGYDGLLLYVDREGEERCVRIDPWEVVIISRGEITEPSYGLRYYRTYDNEARAEFYDDADKYVYSGPDFSKLELKEVKPHLFDYCPLFGLPNNAELQGDADKVLSLIDAYDRSMSDMNNEVEQFRLALLLFIGYKVDADLLEQMRQLGALYIPDVSNGEDIRYLIKELNPAFTDSHLDRLEENITRFAKHVNFTEAFGGGQVTGPAMRYKLFMLETKAKTMERKHEAAMMYMFKVLASAWAKKSLKLDYTQIDVKYTRNIPVNLLDEAQTAQAFMGVLSQRTILSNVSIVTDVDEELARIEEEKAAMEVNLDDPNLNQDEQDGA